MAKKKAESDRPVDGAKPKDGPAVPAAWYDPKTLDDHPDNWKEHPPEQGEVVSELIAKHGWLIPLTLNRRTGRLLNGHERKRIAIEQGMPLVPVWVVDVPEEDELEVIASLDTSGSMAKASAAKVAAIMERWKPQSSRLQEMMERLSKASGIGELTTKIRPTGATGVVVPGDSLQAEWVGMPEYKSQNVAGIVVQVHFERAEDIEEFGRLIGQSLTAKTRCVWHPRKDYEPSGEIR